LGYLVQHVHTGEKAVQAILGNTVHFDLILMDINLGSGMDGTQAAEQILNHKDIPVVFLSSHTEPEIVEKTEKITSYGYVVKNSGIVILNTSIKMAFKLFNANNKLLISQRQFQSAFDNAALGVCFVSLEGRFIDVNMSFTEIFGYSDEEIMSLSFQEITHKDDLAIGSELMKKLLIGEINKAIFEKRYIGKDKRIIHASVATSLIKDANEVPLYFITQIHDISKDKEIESLNRTMAHMLDVAPNSITIHDTEGNFLYANDATFKIHGYTKSEFMSINLHDLDLPESAALLEERFRRIFEVDGATFEVRHYRKDGSSLPLEVMAKTVNWFGKTCVLNIATDITDRKQL
jgi:PAS domain S-box-containing protein